jgi:hypothetical protein
MPNLGSGFEVVGLVSFSMSLVEEIEINDMITLQINSRSNQDHNE